jgi:hypothetical protein
MALPENALKELLSRGFVRLVASHSGFIVATDELDFGSDLSLSHVDAVDDADRVRYTKSGFVIDVQLKATCERNVEVAQDILKYDLRVANYNDLVRRRSGLVPLVLVLFVLPDDPATWLAIAESELTIRRCGYFWRPDDTDAEIDNVATKRISIPLANRLSSATFEDIRTEYLV